MKGSTSEENLQSLEKANVDLKVEMEKIKHEKFDLDNRYKAEVKRNEVSRAGKHTKRKEICPREPVLWCLD